MPASSVQDLLNFEVHFESAAVTFIGSALSGYQVVGTVSDTDLETPRVEVSLEVGAGRMPVTRRQGGASPNTKDFVAYDSFFHARLVTDNAVGQSGDHALARAKLRELFLYSGTNWDNTNLPYYDLKFLQPLEAQYLTDEDFNVTELTWNLKFEIRQGQWPS